MRLDYDNYPFISSVYIKDNDPHYYPTYYKVGVLATKGAEKIYTIRMYENITLPDRKTRDPIHDTRY